MAVIGRGRIVVWEGASLWLFAGTADHVETAAHAHHAIQITFALEGDFKLHSGAMVVAGSLAAVAPDVPHVYEANGLAAHIFVEPDGALGQSLRRQWFDAAAMRELSSHHLLRPMSRLASAFKQNAGDRHLIELGQGLLRELAQGVDQSAPEPRVAAMIDFIGENLDGQITLAAISERARLSPSRASHLFVQRTGLALKTYVLWRRVARAVEMYGQGSNLTEAAHAAGFADSAHFSRAFRRMFGLPAATLQVTQERSGSHRSGVPSLVGD
jgi:AraC-like DNA-binding protein